jgi:hypothetical protein
MLYRTEEDDRLSKSLQGLSMSDFVHDALQLSRSEYPVRSTSRRSYHGSLNLCIPFPVSVTPF